MINKFEPGIKEPDNSVDQDRGRVFAKDITGRWHHLWFNNGYWFKDGAEFQTKIDSWVYPNDLEDTSDIFELDSLVDLIEVWHHGRNLVDGSTSQAQITKLVEEFGELAGAIARGEPVEDHIGDMVVVQILIALQNDTTLTDCVRTAYNEIKNRTGKMVDGIFVKDA